MFVVAALLAVVVVSCVLGGILLILVLGWLVYFCWCGDFDMKFILYLLLVQLMINSYSSLNMRKLYPPPHRQKFCMLHFCKQRVWLCNTG